MSLTSIDPLKLVHEENRTLPSQLEPVYTFVHDLFDLVEIRCRGRHFDKSMRHAAP